MKDTAEYNAEIRDAALFSFRGDICLWEMPLDSIVLIAEYTTDEGPFLLDDYFLVIHSLEGGIVHKAILSNGFESLISDLGKRWGTELKLELYQSTEWKSRVVWPVELRDQRYFKLTPVQSHGAREWMKRKLLGPSLDLGLTDEVKNYLTRFSATAGQDTVMT